MSTNRLEAFSDGVFAIAITLLVLDIDVPTPREGSLGHELLAQWPMYAAYVVSFITIGIILISAIDGLQQERAKVKVLLAEADERALREALVNQIGQRIRRTLEPGIIEEAVARELGQALKADRTYALLKRRGTQFVVVSAAEPDALREASFFVDRLSEERMPLAGLILNRTHPMLCSLPVERAIDGAKTLESEPEGTDGTKALAMAVLQIHADRASTSKREIRLLSRFTGANPHVAIVGVPSLPFDVSDLEALRAIADQMTAVGDDAGRVG